uniref:Uncharacterized protein n=1 Tax=Candidatus Methanophaga sp. ANME-1 ERB7 TaxID=2759913 RepID=A0A7G9Z498_9EURY|nr:hypothetical protein PBMGCBEP_00016 [Methanosarcinales archaeon ANME-1 ERB7]
MSCESKKWIGIAICVAFTILVLLRSGVASTERIGIPADYAAIKSSRVPIHFSSAIGISGPDLDLGYSLRSFGRSVIK